MPLPLALLSGYGTPSLFTPIRQFNRLSTNKNGFSLSECRVGLPILTYFLDIPSAGKAPSPHPLQ